MYTIYIKNILSAEGRFNDTDVCQRKNCRYVFKNLYGPSVYYRSGGHNGRQQFVCHLSMLASVYKSTFL